MAESSARCASDLGKKSNFSSKSLPSNEDSRIRIKLNIEGKDGTDFQSFIPCWYLVNQSVTSTIFALRKDIAGKFNFSNSLSQLFVDGFLVPDWESTFVLRENDTVILRFDADVHSSSTSVNPSSTQKTNKSIIVPSSSKANLGSQASVTRKSSSSSSDSESDDSQDTTVKTPRLPVVKKTAKKVPEQVHKSRKRKVKDTSSSEDSSSSSSDSEEEEKLKLITKVEKGIKSVATLKPVSNCKPSVNNENLQKRSESVPAVSPENTNVREKSLENQNENAMDTSQTDATGEAKDKKRRRRRRRKKPDNNNSENAPKKSDWTPKFTRVTTRAPPQTEGQKHVHFNSDVDDDDNVASNAFMIENTHANMIPAVNTESPGNQASTRQQNDWTWSTGRDRPTPQLNSATQDRESMQSNVQSDSRKYSGKNQSPGSLFTGTQVFNRKKYKKMAYCPLSKDEQLQSWQTNTSVVLQNNTPQAMISSRYNQNGYEVVNYGEDHEPDGSSSSESELDAQPVVDYSKCTLLHGAPRVGDTIAFKIMELSEQYTPEISDYKEGNVTSYDPNTQVINIELTRRGKKRKDGRFDVIVEDEEEVLVGASGVSQTQISVVWTSIVEARLLPRP